MHYSHAERSELHISENIQTRKEKHIHKLTVVCSIILKTSKTVKEGISTLHGVHFVLFNLKKKQFEIFNAQMYFQ